MDKALSCLAYCWRLERLDGVVLGFTTHDRDLEVGALTYRAAPGMLPSAISSSVGFDAAALDVKGALASDAIRAHDLMAGRWDGAAVTLFIVDWQAPDGQQLPLAAGRMGSVSMTGDAFEAELKGAAAMLEGPVVEQTSPECRASLGDARCRVDMAARVRVARLSAIVSDEVMEMAQAAGSAFSYGRLRWISGANSGLESAILRGDGTRLTLREAPPFAPAAGDLVEISEGCDKRLETCAQRFGNGANFRGEPHLPGMDLLTRYPGA